MCKFYDFKATGESVTSNWLAQTIKIFGRVTAGKCQEVRIIVRDLSGTVLFDMVVTPDNTVSKYTLPNTTIEVDTNSITASFDLVGGPMECGSSLSIEMSCLDEDTACPPRTQNVLVYCKGMPNIPCPGEENMLIKLSNASGTIAPGPGCIPAGLVTAEITNAPAGSQFDWTLKVLNPLTFVQTTTQLGTGNPVQFNVPEGNDFVIISVSITVPGCGEYERDRIFPDRHQSDCPQDLSFEIRKDGQIVTATDDLDSGDYVVTVLSPFEVGTLYSFLKDGVPGPANTTVPTFSFHLPNNHTTVRITIVATVDGCCPSVDAIIDLTSKRDEIVIVPIEDPNDPFEDPEDPPADPPEDPPVINWCGIVYVILMAAILAFIASWLTFFSLFPATIIVWVPLAATFALVLALLALLEWVCTVSTCRRLRILAWMFAWCAIGSMITWMISLFVVSQMLVGVLIAGMICVALGIDLARRNCDFLHLFRWP